MEFALKMPTAPVRYNAALRHIKHQQEGYQSDKDIFLWVQRTSAYTYLHNLQEKRRQIPMADNQGAALADTAEMDSPTADFRRLSRGEQRRVLVALIQAGRNDEEIGRMYGLSQWQVRNMRYRLGIKKDRGGNVHVDQTDGAANAPGTVSMLDPFPAAEAAGSLFALTMAGTVTARQLAQRLEGLHAFFSSVNPDRPFDVRLQITEGAAEPA